MNRYFIIVLLLNTLTLTGCTSLNERDSKLTKISAGDQVELVTFSGVTHSFMVLEVSDNTLYTEDGYIVESFDMRDIKSISVEEFSGTKTLLLAAAVLVAAGIGAGVALFF